MNKVDVFLVGRHLDAEIPGCYIVKQEAITWPETANEIIPILNNIIAECENNDIEAIVFQNTPGQLAVALSRITIDKVAMGVIVNKPGERPSVIEKRFYVDPNNIWDVVDAIETANPYVQIETVFPESVNARIEMKVIPAMKFNFSHIEWF